jgi:hypothetical protein
VTTDPYYSPEYTDPNLEGLFPRTRDLSRQEFYEYDRPIIVERERETTTQETLLKPDETETVTVRELRPTAFAAHQNPVTATPTSIVGGNPERTSLVICNLGPDTLFIAADQARCSTYSGFPIPPNTTLKLETLSGIWGVTPTTCNVGILDLSHTAF